MTNPHYKFIITLWTYFFFCSWITCKFLYLLLLLHSSIRQRSLGFCNHSRFVSSSRVIGLSLTSFVQSLQNPRWRITDSNRWPPACKAGALASWANPPWSQSDSWKVLKVLKVSTSFASSVVLKDEFSITIVQSNSPLVVPRRVELRTSTLSVWRSNQLSYETGYKDN